MLKECGFKFQYFFLQECLLWNWMLLNEIVDLMFYEVVGTINVDSLLVHYCFDVKKILACVEYWTEWYILIWMMELKPYIHLG